VSDDFRHKSLVVTQADNSTSIGISSLEKLIRLNAASQGYISRRKGRNLARRQLVLLSVASLQVCFMISVVA
jgi:hypothetical protein